MKDLRTEKGHKENGSSCFWAHGKIAKPKLDHLEFCLCCCLLPGTFLLCLAVESISHYGDGCGDVAYGVWLAGEAPGECLLHLNEPGAVSGWALSDAANHCISYCSASFLLLLIVTADLWQLKPHL